jgi:hypothetical protein
MLNDIEESFSRFLADLALFDPSIFIENNFQLYLVIGIDVLHLLYVRAGMRRIESNGVNQNSADVLVFVNHFF